jgi:hypothetical protein
LAQPVVCQRHGERVQRSTAAARAALISADVPATTSVARADPSGNWSRPAAVAAMSVRSPAMLSAADPS